MPREEPVPKELLGLVAEKFRALAEARAATAARRVAVEGVQRGGAGGMGRTPSGKGVKAPSGPASTRLRGAEKRRLVRTVSARG